jgi:vancomycin resistance protein VanW
MILNSGKIKSGVGGGLCQLSNLIFWITLHTPLTVTERWRHGYDVFPDSNRTQPFGSGATCSYPNIDLQIKNETQQEFQLSLGLVDKYLIGSWLSNEPINFRYQIIEKDHEIKSEWWGGYVRKNKIFRKVVDISTGIEIREELMTQNEAIMMYNPLLYKPTLKNF